MDEERPSPAVPEALHAVRHTVVCIGTDDPSSRLGHAHVIRVETDNGSRRRWSIVELIAAVRRGERFMLGAAELSPVVCPRCPMVTLASEPAEALLGAKACPDG